MQCLVCILPCSKHFNYIRNMTLIKLIFLATILYVTSAVERDYYWREYSGVIPKDAIPGGIDKEGKTTFIAQVYIDKVGLFPGTIYQDSKNARINTAGGKEIFVEHYVKILCGTKLSNFQWITVEGAQIHLMTNCHCIVGGFEAPHQLIIGRANLNQETVIGKVFPSTSPSPGLWLPAPTGQVNVKTFELLTFNCTSNKYCATYSYNKDVVVAQPK